jgi:uncharacterized C2H2 Zn-finger protein
VFASQKGLRSHQKLHEQRDAEEQLRGTLPVEDADADDDRPTKKARRGGEIGRDWKCDFEGCDKDFKSVSLLLSFQFVTSLYSLQKKALKTHKNVSHLGKRDFACTECDKAFGYKHLLQRHTAKMHTPPVNRVQQNHSESDADDEDDEHEDEQEGRGHRHIDSITGKTYADKQKSKPPPKFPCPFPKVDSLAGAPTTTSTSTERCDHGFSRLYDLRRHLQAAHDIETSKEGLQSWMQKRSGRA